MVTLSLFRHAKSSWSEQGLRDFDRPLATRGRKAATSMGRYIAGKDLVPDTLLCSTAARARQTLALARKSWEPAPEIRFEDGLYHASPGDMIGILQSLPESCRHVMLIGHNPGMHALALELAGSGKKAKIAEMKAKFPTAALAVLIFDGPWREIARGKGCLQAFVRPRDLKEQW